MILPLILWYNSFVYDLRLLIVEAFAEVFPNVKGGYEKIRFKGVGYESSHLFGHERQLPLRF